MLFEFALSTPLPLSEVWPCDLLTALWALGPLVLCCCHCLGSSLLSGLPWGAGSATAGSGHLIFSRSWAPPAWEGGAGGQSCGFLGGQRDEVPGPSAP